MCKNILHIQCIAINLVKNINHQSHDIRKKINRVAEFGTEGIDGGSNGVVFVKKKKIYIY
jgi:hypothetical protein